MPRRKEALLMQSSGVLVLARSLICYSFISGTTAQTLSQPGSPRWEQIDTSASSSNGTRYFVDTSFLKPADDGVWATVLVQFRDVQTQGGYAIRSITRSTRVDCGRRRLAVTAIDSFTDARGIGRPVLSIDFQRDPLQWQHVEPGSIDDAILRFICERAPSTKSP